MISEFDSFTEFISKNLDSVQKQFDEYQRGYFPIRPPEFFCLELNGEAGELANAEKKKWKGREVSPELFEDEAADVLIALMNYCNSRQIILGNAVSKKLKKIENIRTELEQEGKEY